MKIKRIQYQTFLQYFLSYIALLLLSLTGILVLLNIYMKQEMMDTYESQSVTRMENLSDQISSLFSNLDQTAQSISNNYNLLYSRYIKNDYSGVTITQELEKYSNGNSVLQSIIYLDLNSQAAFGIQSGVILDEDSIYVTPSTQLSISYKIPYKNLLESSKGKLTVYFAEGFQSPDPLLFYTPIQQSESFAIFFILNYKEFLNLLEIGVAPETPAIALANADNQLLISTDSQLFSPYLNDASCFVETNSYCRSFSVTSSALTLYVAFDQNVLKDSIFHAFQSIYLGILAIGIIGVLVSFLFLKVTYFPLHRLATQLASMYSSSSKEKIHSTKEGDENDIQLIHSVFETMLSENEKLIQKVQNYRVMIQKSILDSLTPEAGASPNLTAYIDRMFDPGVQNHFVVVVFTSSQSIAHKDLYTFLEDTLPTNTTTLLLEQTENQISYLLNFIGPAHPNLQALASAFQPLSYKISFSDISSNPLDISRLYNNAVIALQYSSEPLTFFEGQSFQTANYPYQLFDSMAEDLRSFRYQESLKKVHALFHSLNQRRHPEFFVRCILIDTITLIVGAMNGANIDFQKYNELYYNLLYLCRNTDYAISQKEIEDKIQQMISILSSEISETNLNISQIQKFVEENCLSSDFSVSMTADHFGITMAYMSYLFKKKFHTNFSDYIWNIRLSKAKQLLEQTDLSIEEISLRVGYENPSSFRRKFKETVGVSPSQYRGGTGKSEK